MHDTLATMITSRRSNRAWVAAPQPVDLVVPGRVLLDVGVAPGQVRLGLVVVEVTDEVLDGVVREELAELGVQLGRERLVVGQDQRRLVVLGDRPRQRRRLAGAGRAEQDLITQAAGEPSVSRSIAAGWSPVGWNGATSSKSGTSSSLHRTALSTERTFAPPMPLGRCLGRMTHTGSHAAGHSQRHHAGEPLSPMPTIRRRSERGQSLVEFALVLMPLFVILLAIIQFGFIFNAYVTITNATREGARGTVYVYDAAGSKAQNDLARNEFIKTSLLASMNLLAKTSPNFATGSTWTRAETRSRTAISSSPMCSRAEHWIPMRSRSPSAPPTTRTWSSRSSRSSCQRT